MVFSVDHLENSEILFFHWLPTSAPSLLTLYVATIFIILKNKSVTNLSTVLKVSVPHTLCTYVQESNTVILSMLFLILNTKEKINNILLS